MVMKFEKIMMSGMAYGRLMVLLVLLVSVKVYGLTEELSAKVVAVIDGNTVEVKTDDNETYKLVLLGIDCPELEQEYGEEARSYVERIALKKSVKVQLHGKDRWGNRLAVILLKGEVDLRVELLKAGFAWTAERNPEATLETIRTEAQKRAKGLWKNREPTPPWIFRRQQTMLQPKSS
jgi:endonuclease YncB( thermonuclease family)